MTKLVSLLTPCFNTGRYIHRLLDSVLCQDYPNIEMIVIDDGSTDDSSELIKSYIPKFERKGYTLQYVYQDNQGQSAAINNGLKLIHGEYLSWPDSDDWFATSDAITKLVTELENSDDSVAMVRSQEQIVDEGGWKVLYIHGIDETYSKGRQLFYDCLFHENGFYFCPGGYMIDLDKFFFINGKDIYTEKDAGQNWQIYLPMLYSYECITIPEVLYTVLERRDSHSRGQYKTLEEQIRKLTSYENTITQTLDRIKTLSEFESSELKLKIWHKYLWEKFRLAEDAKSLRFQRDVIRYYRSKNCNIPTKLELKYYANRFGLAGPLKKMLNLGRTIRSRIKTAKEQEYD